LANIMDYIAWRGDIGFALSPFNEVDNLIFSVLAYIDFDGIVPNDGEQGTVTLRQAWERFLREGREIKNLLFDPKPLFERAALSERFGGVRVGRYVREISLEEQFQFAAVTFFPGDGTVYAAYCGTDDSIAGWREDFNFGYMERTRGQILAEEYLNSLMGECKMKVRVGGHSKGGNLAVFAAAFCKEEYRPRIIRVYSNDGPGFSQEVVQSDEYLSVLDRVQLIIPELSLVGVLLNNKEEKKVVKSRGILQHDPFMWEVTGPAFDEADRQSVPSVIAEQAFSRWLDGLDDETKQKFISAVFGTLEATGAETFTEMNQSRLTYYTAIAKALREMEPEKQQTVADTLGRLMASGWESIWDEAKKALLGLASGESREK